jgi:hypothetical protein
MAYCHQCGEEVRDIAKYCSNCSGDLNPTSDTGSDREQATRERTLPSEGPSPKPTSSEPVQREDTSSSDEQTQFYIGAVFGVLAVIFVPFVFVFVALPESISRMFGTTLQGGFPEGARDNPMVSGSMMIFAWFGNFIIFVFVLVLILVILLALS